MAPSSRPEPNGLERARETVRRLRGTGGCPWDRAQTHESLRRYLLEETYEALEALDRVKENPSQEAMRELKEELGDVLLQVLLHAEIAAESGAFTVDELANDLSAKLVRRHPHVFGGDKLDTPEEVVGAWEKTKQKEKPKESALDGIPPGLPALQRSLKVIEKVSKVGFQWPNLQGPLEKMREELGEFEAEVRAAGEGGHQLTRAAAEQLDPDTRRKLEGEMGDLLFTVANVAYFLNLNPEDALRAMLTRFEGRFRHVEKGAKAQGKRLEQMTLAEMDVLWNEAKKRG